MLLDTVNDLLWADTGRPFGLGEHQYCFDFDGTPVDVSGVGDYPLGSHHRLCPPL
jgi:hypothetical protein